MKKLILSTAVIAITASVSSTATAGDIGVSVSTDYVSEYVFRGVSFANTAVQPGIEFSKGGFSAGVWASVGIGETSALAGDEIDLYAGYGWDINDLVSASVGATIYHFPESGGLFAFDGNSSTLEVYAGLALDTVLAPALTGYYDFDLEAFTLEGSVGHGFAVSDDVSFDVGVTGGLVTGSSAYEWATASASLSYGFDDESSIYVGANFSLNSNDNLNFINAGDLAEVEDAIAAGIADLDQDDLDDLAEAGLDIGNLDAVSLARVAGLGGTTTSDNLFWVGTGFSTSF